jgi:hypothetical protein
MNVEDQVEHLRGQCGALMIMLGSVLLLLEPSRAARLATQLEQIAEELHADALADPGASDRSIESCAATPSKPSWSGFVTPGARR